MSTIIAFRFRKGLHRLVSLLSLMLWAAVVSASNGEDGNMSLTGFQSARFGMDVAQLDDALKADGIVETKRQQHDDYLIVQAQLDRDWSLNPLTYVLADQGKRLALVIETYPDLLSALPLEKQFNKKYGKPLSEKATAELKKRIEQDLPPGVQKLTVWAFQSKQGTRFLRLLSFEDHVAVEYLDPVLLAGS